MKEKELVVVNKFGARIKIRAIVIKRFGQYAEILTRDARKRYAWCHSAVKLGGEK